MAFLFSVVIGLKKRCFFLRRSFASGCSPLRLDSPGYFSHLKVKYVTLLQSW